MENNRVLTMSERNEILSVEDFPTCRTAHDYYMECIRTLKRGLSVGESVTVIRMRWDRIMTMETVEGRH